MTEPRLTDHDQLLVNLCAGMAVMAIPSREEVARDLEQIREVLPRVSRDGILIRDLAAACEGLVGGYAGWTDPVPAAQEHWHRAWFDLRLALEKIMRWRAQAVRQRLGTTEARPCR